MVSGYVGFTNWRTKAGIRIKAELVAWYTPWWMPNMASDAKPNGIEIGFFGGGTVIVDGDMRSVKEVLERGLPYN